VMRTVLVPGLGAVASSLRSASARRLFSLGEGSNTRCLIEKPSRSSGRPPRGGLSVCMCAMSAIGP